VSAPARTVGVVSPGAMGSAVGAALARGGARVVATLAGRSERTSRLAKRAGIELLADLESVVRVADVVLSIAPPEAARVIAGDIARASRDGGERPLVADLNAVSPETARAIADELARAQVDLVDGSISGPPPWTAGTTRIYLSGARARELADLPFDGVDRIVVGDKVGGASAVKMSTASVYKGTSALLAQALLAAQANGVLEHVLEDLRAGAPELVAKVERRLASAASKSGRYVGEMHEIAATQAAAGLTPALFEALAEVYAALAETDLARATAPESLPEASLAEVLGRLRSAPTDVG
jgi:3-hydroxyisobutyrate dehydrogenase-like beta-hydroxyacid dehydrogenase